MEAIAHNGSNRKCYGCWSEGALARAVTLHAPSCCRRIGIPACGAPASTHCFSPTAPAPLSAVSTPLGSTPLTRTTFRARSPSALLGTVAAARKTRGVAAAARLGMHEPLRACCNRPLFPQLLHRAPLLSLFCCVQARFALHDRNCAGTPCTLCTWASARLWLPTARSPSGPTQVGAAHQTWVLRVRRGCCALDAVCMPGGGRCASANRTCHRSRRAARAAVIWGRRHTKAYVVARWCSSRSDITPPPRCCRRAAGEQHAAQVPGGGAAAGRRLF